MDYTRRRNLAGALGLALVPTLSRAQAPRPYPDRPVSIYVPTPPGGALDMATRLIADELRTAWGQPVLIETRPGTSGGVAAGALVRTPADGQTLLTAGTGLLNNLLGPTRQPYGLEDLAPICLTVLIPAGFGVRASLGVGTLQEFIALARSRPGKLTVGVPGVGSGSHVVAELLNQAAGIRTLMVQYKGEAPAAQDLMGGTIDAMCGSFGGVTQYPGRIVPLALANPTRHPRQPEVPTFADAGLAEANLPGWAGLFTPAATPRQVIEKVASGVARAVAMPDVASKLLASGLLPSGAGPEKLGEIIQTHMRIVRGMVSDGKVSFT